MILSWHPSSPPPACRDGWSPGPAWTSASPRAPAGPLTMVTGPPGAGKTIALASWAAAGMTPVRVAWVTLDDYDNQPGSFWSHVVKALRQVGVPVEETVPALPHTRASARAFLPRLASALAALDPPLVLVLDDLHLLTAPRATGRAGLPC